MRRTTTALLAAALLPAGCVAPCAYNNCYAQPAYAPPPAYQPPPPPGPPPGYPPGYPPPGYPPSGEAYVGPDGLTYVDGYPVTQYEGVPAPFIFLPEFGGWGFYDREHHWHGAPPNVRERLEHEHPGGRGLPPGGFRGGPPDAFRGGPPPGVRTGVPGPQRPPEGRPPENRPPEPRAERRPERQEHRCPPDRPGC